MLCSSKCTYYKTVQKYLYVHTHTHNIYEEAILASCINHYKYAMYELSNNLICSWDRRHRLIHDAYASRIIILKCKMHTRY